MKTALAASGQTESEAIRMKEKSQVADIDRSVYDIRDKEDDAYRMQEGLTPELNTPQLLAYLPRIAQLCHVDCIQLYSLDSTSIHPTHWLGTAQAIREYYDD